MKIYDSLYDNIDGRKQGVIYNMFGSEALPDNVKVHKQQGVKDCGLFAMESTVLNSLLRTEDCGLYLFTFSTCIICKRKR